MKCSTLTTLIMVLFATAGCNSGKGVEYESSVNPPSASPAALEVDRLAMADMRQMQGTWEVAACLKDGKPASHYIGLRYVFKDNKFMQEGEEKVFGTIKLDPTTTPKRNDFTSILEGKARITPFIYQFESGQLTTCGGNTRPTEFQTSPGDGRTLTVFHRVEQ